MAEFGKILIFIGLLLAILGFVFIFGNKIPFIGRLPGDIAVERRNYSFYFPVATCIIISVVISFILWLFNKK
ncbi:MAG: DUF2905 domain-containing protein [Candidatus Neomarinimicrobiota bacterium]